VQCRVRFGYVPPLLRLVPRIVAAKLGHTVRETACKSMEQTCFLFALFCDVTLTCVRCSVYVSGAAYSTR
jgi:hypothetical protein